MWKKCSLWLARDECGNAIYGDITMTDAGRYGVFFYRAETDSEEIIFASFNFNDITEYIDSFVESQNSAERNFHFNILGETVWKPLNY